MSSKILDIELESFRLATPNDLQALKVLYDGKEPEEQDSEAIKAAERDRTYRYTLDMQWGLKHLGYLYVYHSVLQAGSTSVLEIGAGFNCYLDRILEPNIDYHMVDDTQYYPTDTYSVAIQKRKRTTYHEGLMGSFLPSVKEKFFDAIVSVSAIEHHPIETLDDLYRDMFRALKPGGRMFHTIDVEHQQCPEYPAAHYSSMMKAGFRCDAVPHWDWAFGGSTGSGPFIQPVSISFAPWRPGNMSRPANQTYPIAAILCAAQRPCD